MAKVVLTEAAKLSVRMSIAEMAACAEPVTPVFVVRRWFGVRDNRRGPNGEVLWDVLQPAGWICEVAPWRDSSDNPLEDHVAMIDELRILVLPLSETEGGVLFVDSVDGAFTVKRQKD